MNKAPWIEQIDAADKALNECTMSFDHLRERLSPILDHLKQSTFQPDIKSYITLDAKYHQDKSYSIELNAKYSDSEIEIFLCNGHGQADEARKYLKSLNELTADMLEFIDKHYIRTASE